MQSCCRRFAGPFPLVVGLAGGTPVHILLQEDNHYAYDLAAAKQALSPRTKAILVNSPHNPTGGVVNRGRSRGRRAFAAENDLLLILDDAYDQMIYEGKIISPAAFPRMRERTIICGTLSKTYAMTGWRPAGTGSAMHPDRACRDQDAAERSVVRVQLCPAWRGRRPDRSAGLRAVDDGRIRPSPPFGAGLAGERLGLEITTIPEGAFYVFPRITLPHVTGAGRGISAGGRRSRVVDGRAFGEAGNGHFRLSYAVSYEDCREGLERIAAAMGRLAKAPG